MKLKQLAFFIVLPFFIQAQNLNLKLGSIGPMIGQISFSHYIGMGANHYYYAQLPNVGKRELLAYDLNHKLTGRTDLELNVSSVKTMIEEIVSTKNNSYALSTGYDAKSDKSYVFLHKVLADGKIENLGNSILEESKNIGVSHSTIVMNLSSNDNTGLYTSPDSTMLVYTESASNDKTSDAERLGVAVVDENLNKKWERVIKLKDKDGVASIKHTFLTNDGRVIITVWVHDTKDYRHKKIAFNKIKLFVIDKNNTKEIDCDFSADVAPADAVVMSCTGNEIIVGGSYDVAYDCANGAYMLKADIESGKITSYKTQPMKMEDLDYGRAKGELKKHNGLEGLNLVSCIISKDGSNIITLTQTASNSSAIESFDKIIFAFDKDINPKYTFGIKGWTAASSESSVMTIPFSDGYLVLYLDNDVKCNLLAIYVNGKGEKSAPQIFPIGKMYFRPTNSQQIDNKRILIEGEAWGNFQFGTLSLK